MRDEIFAKKCEPFIHFIVITFSLSTAIGGVFMDVFHESENGASCWVAAKPGEDCWNDSCGAERIAWIFGGIPNVFCFFSGKIQEDLSTTFLVTMLIPRYCMSFQQISHRQQHFAV